MKVLGIDPGAGGALAIIDTNTSGLVVVEDMPTVTVKRGKTERRTVSAQALTAWLKLVDVDQAVIEQVGAMPGQGVSAMFQFGRAAGVVEGCVAGAGIPITYITPQEWKRVHRVKGGKDASRHRAMELWPGQADLFVRKKDDGRAEAALIAATVKS